MGVAMDRGRMEAVYLMDIDLGRVYILRGYDSEVCDSKEYGLWEHNHFWA